MKEGQVVIVNNNNSYQVGMVINKIVANKKTLYDVLLESRSVICAVPRNATNASIYISDEFTERFIISGKLTTTLPDFKFLTENELIPAFRAESSGPRSF